MEKVHKAQIFSSLLKTEFQRMMDKHDLGHDLIMSLFMGLTSS